LNTSGNRIDSAQYTENANFWIKIIREDLDPYRLRLTNDAVLNAMGASGSLRALDAGCGEGYMSRLIAQRGAAKVVGVDLCADLVEAAQTAAQELALPIEYHTASVTALPLADESFDVVVCNHIVNDLERPEPAFHEFARVLVPGGRLVIMMLHPCFYSGHAERTAQAEAPRPADYFGVRIVEQQFQVAGITSPAKVKMWFRPLEAYTTALAEAGFSLTQLSEPHPSVEDMRDDPWWQANFKRPLFLLMVATKQ
jgi:2-polyprenyl-3-methyl-5-hydroxy-6-metoxy-1,4-benzoquinol methylase